MAPPIRITPAAAWLLMTDLRGWGEPGDVVRLSVVGFVGGLQYGIDFEPGPRRDDLVFDLPNGGKVAIDPRSAELMADIVVDAKPVVGDPEGRPGLWFRKDG